MSFAHMKLRYFIVTCFFSIADIIAHINHSNINHSPQSKCNKLLTAQVN